MVTEWTVEAFEAEHGYGSKAYEGPQFTRSLDDLVLDYPEKRDYDALTYMLINDYLGIEVTYKELEDLLSFKPTHRSNVISRVKHWLERKGYRMVSDCKARTSVVERIS